MPISKSITNLLFIYFGFRLFSYFFSPSTPLYAGHWLNTIVAAAILSLAAFWLIKKDIRGWYVIALEIILGGAGGFLSVGPLSLRTALLLASIPIYGFQHLKLDIGYFIRNLKLEIKNFFPISKSQYPIFLLIIIALVSALRGWLNGHDLRLIFADTIPYFFLWYYFPLRRLWAEEKFRALIKNAFWAAVGGNFLFILFTLAGFSSGFFVLQDSYYHWYRDVALGKITELGPGLYRLVLNEHLLLPVAVLYFFAGLFKKEKNAEHWPLLVLLFSILSVNLTRIYIVAIVAGAVFFLRRANWRLWLKNALFAGAVFALIFSAVNFTASRGQSLGWELFGLRLNSIVRPRTEDSSLSRLLLLPKIWEKIKNKPLLGQGLGDTVTAYSPLFQKNITTPHFDWGYLEIWAEMGGIGLAIWLFFIVYVVRALKRQPLADSTLWPAFISLLVINITSPALFHVLGILLLIFILNINIYEHEHAIYEHEHA